MTRAAAPPSSNSASDASIGARTLRLTLMLVGACVVFVGALSLVALTVTRAAVGPGRVTEEAPAKAARPAKPGDTHTDVPVVPLHAPAPAREAAPRRSSPIAI